MLPFLVFCLIIASQACQHYANCGTCVSNHCFYVEFTSGTYECVAPMQHSKSLLQIKKTYRTIPRCESLFRKSRLVTPSPTFNTPQHPSLPTTILPETSTVLIERFTEQPARAELSSVMTDSTSPSINTQHTTEWTRYVTSEATSTIHNNNTPSSAFNPEFATTSIKSTSPLEISSVVTSFELPTSPHMQQTSENPPLITSETTDYINQNKSSTTTTKPKNTIQKVGKSMPLNEKALRRKIRRDACRLAHDFIIYKEINNLGPFWLRFAIANPMNRKYAACAKLFKKTL